MSEYTLHLGDCLEKLKELPDQSIDSVVTDPPAGIGFMGKDWDHHKGGRDQWIEWMQQVASECLRVLKPGGHALVWAIPRTSHWTATAWENAGFEVRDRIAHCFGSGFPKNLNVALHIDKAAGVIGDRGKAFRTAGAGDRDDIQAANGVAGMAYGEPITDDAKQWQGWGTALKPAIEDWWLLRKPMSSTTVKNVLEHGTGALNIDGCRVESGNDYHNLQVKQGGKRELEFAMKEREFTPASGRWPANICHDGSDDVVELFPNSKSCNSPSLAKPEGVVFNGARSQGAIYPGENGSAARFFYCSKASRTDRHDGLIDPGHQFKHGDTLRKIENKATDRAGNHHPTVKPVELMKWLCRLITPPGGTILDCFMGSGSTGKAAMLEGFNFIGIERDPEYLEIARARIQHAITETSQTDLFADALP